MLSDQNLVREFAESNAESAFGELVRRHIDLVYSTALRGVAGDKHLAEDIAQSVFIDLARKARILSARHGLTGWLYKSTCFAAAKAVRSERRRQTREREAYAMQNQMTDPTDEPDWQQLGPVLNAVMLELKEGDREVLLQRFFQRRSLEELGMELGLNSNAARMRVERALNRLRELLLRRGITSTAVGLTAVLTLQAVSAAPTGLAAAITSATLTTAGAATGSSILTFITMTNAKAVTLGAALVVGAVTPIVLQHQTNVHLRRDLEAARAQSVRSAPADPQAADPTELAQLRREHDELMRLRGDVAQLRQRIRTPKNQAEQNEFERAKAAKLARLGEEAAEAQVLLAKAPDIPMLPASSWANVGYNTPAAALQTLNWAVAHHDTNAVVNGISWDPQARIRADELFATLPESIRQQYGSLDAVMFDWLVSHATPTASFRVLSQTEQGTDDMTLVEQHQYNDDRVRENPVQFHRDETGNWRQVIPQELMPKLEVVINNLASAGAPAGNK
jgi:RNA polymerase sigma factor (sigma-70 family)